MSTDNNTRGWIAAITHFHIVNSFPPLLSFTWPFLSLLHGTGGAVGPFLCPNKGIFFPPLFSAGCVTRSSAVATEPAAAFPRSSASSRSHPLNRSRLDESRSPAEKAAHCRHQMFRSGDRLKSKRMERRVQFIRIKEMGQISVCLFCCSKGGLMTWRAWTQH